MIGVQINLLPDIKQKFIKAQRQKRFVTLIASWILVVSVGLLVLMLVIVFGWQQIRLRSLNNTIAENSSEIKKIADIDKILTIQNQLNVITSLHEQKPVAERLFPYMQQLVPAEVTVSNLNVNFIDGSISITGNAPNLGLVNQFVDTLKFTKYKAGDDGSETQAFDNVVLSNFTRSDDQATYVVNFEYDTVLFSGDSNVALVVPNIITSRSEVERPGNLFVEQPTQGANQ